MWKILANVEFKIPQSECGIPQFPQQVIKSFQSQTLNEQALNYFKKFEHIGNCGIPQSIVEFHNRLWNSTIGLWNSTIPLWNSTIRFYKASLNPSLRIIRHRIPSVVRSNSHVKTVENVMPGTKCTQRFEELFGPTYAKVTIRAVPPRKNNTASYSGVQG